MTSPPAQPTIADTVRLTDSLSTQPEPRKAPTASRLVLRGSMRQLVEPCQGSTIKPQEVHYENDPRRLNGLMSQDRSLHGDESAKIATNKEAHSRSEQIPSLPAEIIIHIATFLLPTSPSTTTFPCKHCSPPSTGLAPAGTSIASLLSLSSTSRAFRNFFAPLIWHTIVIRTPQHLPRLSALLKNYDTLSVRSLSPSSTRRRDSTSPSPISHSDTEKLGLNTSEGPGLRHPLPHIKSIIVSIPDKYLDFDQTYLLTLLRSMHLSRTEQLEHLYWSAEAVPNPAMWPLLGPSLKSLQVDGRTFYQGHNGMAGLDKLESLSFTGYESTLLPSGVVAFFRAQSFRVSEGGGDEGEVREIPEGSEEEMGRGRGESPLQELQRAATSPRRQAQHLYLDPPSSSSPPHPSSSSPALTPSSPLPPPSPTRIRLQHLSLSTSKTSLLHQPSLISTHAFSSLTCLDIYAVTPEPPLATSILTFSSTLTHLRLILDISGAFSNYNSLWRSLTSHLPRLTWLQVDPMPQQNTAPSFWDFVQSCTQLKWINARKKDSFPPCFGGFDPSHPSGALPF